MALNEALAQQKAIDWLQTDGLATAEQILFVLEPQEVREIFGQEWWIYNVNWVIFVISQDKQAPVWFPEEWVDNILVMNAFDKQYLAYQKDDKRWIKDEEWHLMPWTEKWVDDIPADWFVYAGPNYKSLVLLQIDGELVLIGPDGGIVKK